MHARIGTWSGDGEELERWVERTRREVVPQVRAAPGSCGVLALLDREHGRALTITLWESEEAMRASEERRASLQSGTAGASGATVETARYEVVHAVGEDDKLLVRRYLEAIDANDSADWSVLDEFLAEDFVAHDPPAPGVALDREGMKDAAEFFRLATPGRHEVTLQVAEGGFVATRIVGRGRHTGELFGVQPTGAEVETAGIAVHRVRAGRIVEYWAATDVLRVLRAIGAA